MSDQALSEDSKKALLAEWRNSSMAASLDIQLVDISQGEAVLEGRPSPKFYNAQLRLHGGYVASLIDSGLGCAVQSLLGAGAGFGTVELNVHFVRKIDEATGRLICTGKVLHAGRTMLTAEAKVADEAGKLYAHGTGTFLVYPS